MRLSVALLSMLLLLSLSTACSQGPNIEGRYEAASSAVDSGETSTPKALLVLDGNGKGEWIVDGITTACTWNIRGDNEVLLHTKAGGVIAGSLKTQGPENHSIHFELPGVGELIFLQTSQ